MAPRSWIGQKLNGRYEILELLGQGGMSAVYKANDPNLRRIVAIKLIHPHLSTDPEFVRRFEAEAAAVAQLRHPHIIQVYDFNHDDNNYYIVFEFVPGETLQARLQRLAASGRPFAAREALDIAAKTAGALEYAHSKGLIHRDIKPANIMINVMGEPIVTDFGIAKIMGETQHTATGAVLGTAKYMSPEQIRGERIDGRTDIYALGATLYEMLTGQPPFIADNPMTLMMMHMTDPVPDVRVARPDVTEVLTAVFRRAMAKNASERYQSAAEFATALQNAAAAPPVNQPLTDTAATQLVPPPTAVQQPPPPPAVPPPAAAAGGSRPNWLLIGGIVAVMAVLAIFALMAGNGSGGNEEATAAALAVLTPTPTETAVATNTHTATATRPTATATGTATRTPRPTATTRPTQTATTAVTSAPTATSTTPPTSTTAPTATTAAPPPLSAAITNITIDNGTYVVAYTTTGYTEQLPGQHVHFYWNNIRQDQAGVGATAASWVLYGGPRPFTGYTVTDRPAGVTAMCIIVANANHTIILDTGNCYPLPEG